MTQVRWANLAVNAQWRSMRNYWKHANTPWTIWMQPRQRDSSLLPGGSKLNWASPLNYFATQSPPQSLNPIQLFLTARVLPDQNREASVAAQYPRPSMAQLTGLDAGQPAHYMLRWYRTCGEARPWSETVSATVGA